MQDTTCILLTFLLSFVIYYLTTPDVCKTPHVYYTTWHYGFSLPPNSIIHFLCFLDQLSPSIEFSPIQLHPKNLNLILVFIMGWNFFWSYKFSPLESNIKTKKLVSQFIFFPKEPKSDILGGYFSCA